MAELDDAPDISGKDSSEDQDIPSKCHDSVGDPVVNDIDDILNSSNENIKIEEGDDIAKEEEDVKTDDEEYFLDQLEEAEEELKRWREEKRQIRSKRRDADSDEEIAPAILPQNADSDDGAPEEDDKKNDALAFQRIIKRLDASEEKFMCDVCDEMLKTPASLSSHLVRVHRKLKCPDCPKFLATQQSLRMHIFTHIPEIEWPYECEYCQKRFKMRSDLPKHFNSILHRHDPEIPDKDTNEYYAILDRSFTKPDPTQYLFSLIEEVPTIIECPGCGLLFVPGPGYDQHIQECEYYEEEPEESQIIDESEDVIPNDPSKDLMEEKQEDKDADNKDDKNEVSKELMEEKQEDKDTDKKELIEKDMTESLPSEDKESTNIVQEETKEAINMDNENIENSEIAIQGANESTTKIKIGPASKIGRLPYKGPRRKIGPASKLGRRQIGPRFLRKIPLMIIEKLPNSTRQCKFCDNICTKLSEMVNHTLSHFTDEIAKNLPTEDPFICPTCSAEYNEKTPLIRHVAFTHRAVLEHCKEEELKGRLVACESDDVVAPELPKVAKGKAAVAKRRGSYKKTKSDDDFVDDSDYTQSSDASVVSSSGSSDDEYNSDISKYSTPSRDSGSDSDEGGAVRYDNSASESDEDSDDDYYNYKKRSKPKKRKKYYDSEDDEDSDEYHSKKKRAKTKRRKPSKKQKVYDSDEPDSVDYESLSEGEQDSDEYNIKKPPRALGWESD